MMRVIDVGSICSLYGQQLPKAFNRKGRKEELRRMIRDVEPIDSGWEQRIQRCNRAIRS
jgi:hypothetical protein